MVLSVHLGRPAEVRQTSARHAGGVTSTPDPSPDAVRAPPAPGLPTAPPASRAAATAVHASGAPVAYSGPVAAGGRFVAPDLLRGVALLGIALANSVYYVTDRVTGPLARPVDGSTGDHVADVLVGTLVDNRSFPLFTLLFAYGFTVLVQRQAAHGVPRDRARALLLRRSLWLVVFGALHVVFLFEGDVLLSYGLLGLVLAAMFAAGDRAFRVVGWSTLVVFLAVAGQDGLAGGGATEIDALPIDVGTVLGDALWRLVALVALVFTAPLAIGMLLPLAVLGTLLGRRRVLERPAEHLPLLRRLALVGFPVSVLGALPLVLATVGSWQPAPVVLYLLGVLHGATGVVGALALLGLVGWWVGAQEARTASVLVPTSAPVRALVSVGRRSLTCYLLQSVLFVLLLKPWALGLGVGAGTLSIGLIAVGVWLVTVVVAVLLERAGRQGPAEWVLRRLTYGRPAVPQAA